MKTFVKNTFSSCLGSLLAIGLILLVVIIAISSYTSKNKANQKGILHIPFEGSISDYASSSINLSQLDFTSNALSLWDLKNKISAASKDKNIKGIFLDFKSTSLNQETALELGEYLSEFKETGKKIFAYSYYFDQNAYFLATFADSIFLNPNGGVDLKGYAIYAPFFNSILEELNIDINIYYAGKYKSSTEPYRFDSFTKDNRFQYNAFLGELRSILVNVISSNRKLDKTKVSSIIKVHKVYDAEFMEQEKIVDDLLYNDEFDELMKKEFGDAKLVPFSTYKAKASKTKGAETALVFAEGEIQWGGKQAGAITYEGIAETFKSIKEDDDIRNVVLRINSPGGNGYTSDMIYREIKVLQAKGKKVYASLGPYATSGGYYIAAACDSIFASENTMTGSIGVYIMLPTINRFLENKLQISVDSIKTDEHAVSYTPLMGISENQNKELIEQTENLYNQFLDRVSEGRKIDKDSVRAIAQGRIWTGKKAKEIGLVDGIMNLSEILDFANFSKTGLKVYPEQKHSFQDQLMNSGLEKFKIRGKNDIKFIQAKVAEIQKIMEKPTPSMKIPCRFFVTNQ